MNHNPIIEKYDTLRNGSHDGLLRNMTHLNETVMFTEQTPHLVNQNHFSKSTNFQAALTCTLWWRAVFMGEHSILLICTRKIMKLRKFVLFTPNLILKRILLIRPKLNFCFLIPRKVRLKISKIKNFRNQTFCRPKTEIVHLLTVPVFF